MKLFGLATKKSRNTLKIKGMNTRRFLFLLLISWSLFSCSSRYATVQSELESVLYTKDFAKANEVIDNSKVYQKERNSILYHLEKGKLLFLEGKHEESNTYLNQADLFVEDFKHTAGNQVLSLLVNDLMQDYRPKDFEVLGMYYYKALNYMALADYESALVEAKRMNLYLQTMDDRYKNNQKHFANDAFTNNLMGLIYEQDGDINNAFVAYRNAADLYLSYQKQGDESYLNVTMPKQLKIDLLRMARANGFTAEYQKYNAIFQLSEEELQNNDVLVFWENGLAPRLSYESIDFGVNRRTINGQRRLSFEHDRYNAIDVAVNDQQWNQLKNTPFVRINIPVYRERNASYSSAVLTLESIEKPLELAEDYFTIAQRVQKSNFTAEIGKTLLRIALKEAAKQSVVNALEHDDEEEENKEEQAENTAQETVWKTSEGLPTSNGTEKKQLSVFEREKENKEEQKQVEPIRRNNTIEKDSGIDASVIAGALFSIYNYASEQPDTRQWLSLPSELHYTRISKEQVGKPISLQLRTDYQNGEKTLRLDPSKENKAFIYFSTY